MISDKTFPIIFASSTVSKIIPLCPIESKTLFETVTVFELPSNSIPSLLVPLIVFKSITTSSIPEST